ncbi:MAG: amino acid adenylation domain-containing protein [Candidatus Aminicenantes bacterium]|nr:amino acid adenylation domain-containing protein [Candidatus Aminicenantes bacterium]
MIPKEEKNKILFEFNKQACDYPKVTVIHSLYEEQVEKTPDHIAVVGRGRTLFRTDTNNNIPMAITYRELNKKAGQISWRLRDEGFNPGDIAAIMVEPSQEMIIGLMAILKAGGAFLPMKDGTPIDRINYMLLESSARFLLTRPPLAQGVTFKGAHIYLDDEGLYNAGKWDTGPVITPCDSAYVIYTSGSTGKPKGVMVEHRGLVNLCCWHNRYFNVTANDRASKYAGFGFDASVWEIFPYMIIGASLYIVPEEIKLDVRALNRFYEDKGITIGFLPTQVAEQFMSFPNNSLRTLQVGGDKLRTFIKRDYRLVNCYGPTENTVCAAAYPVTGFSDNIPIGKPIANNQIYIVDKNDYVQPVGVPGELCIAGDSLARGYLNNPELTFEKFKIINYKLKIKNGSGALRADFHHSSFIIHHSILYRTCDLARWLDDGNIEFLGRIDSQVKIRGFRIELGEIENQLLQCEKVKEAVVIAREDVAGQKYLCAYIVPIGTPNIEAIKAALLKNLPDYMIPSFFIQLEEIPLTPNGKIDVRALPAPEAVAAAAYEAPTDEVEEILAQTWAEVLGFEKIGVHDNFFEIGGDSIKTILISSKLFKWGLTVNVHDFFLYPTIRGLAKNIKKIEHSIHQGIVAGNVPLTPIQEWFFEQPIPERGHFNQSILLSRDKGFNEDYIKKVFTTIVSHHDALRMVYKIENNAVIQENRGSGGKLFDLELISLKSIGTESALAEFKEEANRVQRSIDLQNGPLVKLALFKGLRGDHLLVVIHHLVIDSVSWRILLEDFETGYAQAEKGEEIKFPDKTDSFQYWARKLNEYAGSKLLLKEIPYWQVVQETEVKRLPVDHEIRVDQRTFENNEMVPMLLGEEKTHQLLTKINWAYNTEINDILLAALGLTVKQWAGLGKIPVNLEGHGREQISADVNISRTVGWFTTQYPVILDMQKADDISFAVKNTKETLRRVPKKGIGYGVLQYITPLDKKKLSQPMQAPEILFNYLGEFKGDNYGIIDRASEISSSCTGDNISPAYPVSQKIDIEGVTRDGQLRLDIYYNRYEYKQATIEKFARLLQTNLEKVIDHCLARKQKEATPSDLGCHKISIVDLERITGDIQNHIGKDMEIQLIYPLSPMQSGMLFHWLKDKQSPAYFEQTEISFRGDIQPLLFEEALNAIVARYDVLRTIFACEGLVEPLQIVLKERKTHLHYEDISRLNEADREKYLEGAREKDRERGFDLFKDHLTRFSLLKTGDQAHVLMWTFHHTLMDGWCLGIIRRELTRVYRLLEKGEPVTAAATPEPTPPPYVEYIRWLEKQDKEEGLRFWEQYLEGYEEPAGLPRMGRAVKGDGYQKAEYHFTIADELMAGMNRLAGQYQATVNTFFQAVWGVLLQKYNNRDDVVFGSIVSGRTEEITGVERMVGLFINMTPIRVKNLEKQDFALLLEKLQVDSLGVKNYEYLPIAEVQSRSELKGDLIDHIIVFENYLREAETEAEEGLVAVDIKAFEQTNYDFNIIVLPWEGLHVHFSYNALVYDRDIIENISRHFEKTISQVVDTPNIILRDIDILSETEKEKVLCEFNDTKNDYPSDKTILQLFEAQVVKTPNNIALVFNGKQLNYSELNKKANQLARTLRAKGVEPNFPAAIMVKPSQEMIIGLLAILKAGGAFLPLDHNVPEDRVKYILKESGTRLLLTSDDLSKKITCEVEIIIVENADSYNIEVGNQEQVNTSRDMAYIIYTSGSTGKPKGVMVEHRSLVNLCSWHNKYFEVTAKDRAAKYINFGFDVSVCEIFPSLAIGAAIYIVPEEIKLDIHALNRFYEDNGITLGWMPSQIAAQFMTTFNRSLRILQVGGDKLKNFVKRNYRLYNCYGPTENTVCATTYPVTESSDNIPIGKPIANNQIYILAKNNHLQSVGVPGELCIGGDGLARGYLNNPELTFEKFDRDLWDYKDDHDKSGALRADFHHSSFSIHHSKLYRTGDLARWQPGGNIEFLGRIDFQVKIRGFRIELGEIESQLLRLENIKEAVVLTKDDNSGEKVLCAFFTAKETIAIPSIRDNLSKSMPSYMVPSYFMQIDQFPLTPNGKLDRKALPDPETTIRREYTPPTNETEKTLADVWAEVLNKKVSIHDNFFEIGGDSIKTIIISGRLQRRQMKINVNDFYAHPTIRKLALHIDKGIETPETKPITRDESLIAGDIRRDYENYLQQVNQEKWPALAEKNVYKHILITGAAGYLGAYLTHQLLQLSDAALYLPIRGKSREEAEERLKKKMTFYFGAEFYNTQKHRLVILNSNLREKQLGLPGPQYEELSAIVDTIVHSAANVKHYGDYEEFYKDNVEATEQLLEFALTGKKKTFHFISTMDTGAGDIPGKDYLLFTEYCHDEGQESENVYVKSKLESEKRVLAYREKGIYTSIYRAGNMTFHSETGRFQENIEGNFFYSMLNAFIKIGFWTDKMKKLEFDLSFVNLAARAIALLLTQKQLKNETYHICNPHFLSWEDMEILLKETGVKLPEVKPGDPRDFFTRYEGNSEYEKIIERVKLYSWIWEGKPATVTAPKMDRTILLLNKLGFQWPEATKTHIDKMIAHCKEVGFI